MGKKEKRIWNAAIDAVVAKLQRDFVAPEVVIKLVEEVRKETTFPSASNSGRTSAR